MWFVLADLVPTQRDRTVSVSCETNKRTLNKFSSAGIRLIGHRLTIRPFIIKFTLHRKFSIYNLKPFSPYSTTHFIN